jgi:hypothetical protein
MILSCSESWRHVGIYLYTQGLDPLSLAWEYLRRNPDYQDQYHRALALGESGPPEKWCLERWEDPGQDSRTFEPQWQYCGSNDVVLVKEPNNSAAPVFSIWAIPGRKTAYVDGDGMTVLARRGPRALRIRLTGDLADGDRFSFAIQAGPGASASIRAAREFIQSLRPATSGPSANKDCPRMPNGVLNMHRLRALDGEAAGASHRQIADELFGRVSNEQWVNSPSRSRVRYLLKSAHAQCTYGYRRMIGAHDDPGVARQTTEIEQSTLDGRADDESVAEFKRKDFSDAEP